MQIDTIRFGKVDIDEKKIIKFDDGIPGLDECNDFALLQFDDSYPIVWLQSVSDGNVCLPVLDTFSAIPDYAFNIDDEDVERLKLTKPEELHVISVLVIPDDIEQMTVNLAAPIIINTLTGKAKQVILGGTDYNVRAPIFQGICKLIREEAADAGSVKEAE